MHILDNEFLFEMKKAVDEVKYQLVPPYLHRRNAVERATRTFKNHLIIGLRLCDTQFLAREWDRFIPQAQLILNFPHSSRRNPSLSAYVALMGNINFNATPRVPPGTKVLLHTKPQKMGHMGCTRPQ